MQGLDGSDTLRGGEGNDSLEGGAGNDTLEGQFGADRLAGGAGDDFYTTADTADTFVELAGEGVDTVMAASNHVLQANFEHLVLVTGGRIGTGNDDANRITGHAGKNSLYGMGGDDTLEGGASNDKLFGGAGGDLFVFGSGSGLKDRIGDFNLAEGDRLQLASNLNGSGIVDGASALAATHDVNGQALVDFGGGNTLVLVGVTTAMLTEDAFVVL
jgi:Ca2+-binding RTX toxin-like protein